MAESPSGRMPTKEEMAYLESMYQNQYTMVGNAINSALEELQQLNSASIALENIDVLAGKESFSSIGADFYLKSQIKRETKVIIGVGGGFMVEKEMESAKQTVKKRMDAKNAMMDKLVKSRRELEAAMIDIQQSVVPGQSV